MGLKIRSTHGTHTIQTRKWFLQALGHEGLNNLLVAYEDKAAQAVCTFAYCEGPGHDPLIFQGRTDVSAVCSLREIPEADCLASGQDCARPRRSSFW